MRINLLAFAMSFIILPALAQTTLRGTPDETFKYVSHEEIAKRQMTPWPGEVYASAFTSDHEYFFVEFVKRLDHGNYIEQHTHWIDQTLKYGTALRAARDTSGSRHLDGSRSESIFLFCRRLGRPPRSFIAPILITGLPVFSI